MPENRDASRDSPQPDERDGLVTLPITRPPSYGTLSASPPYPFSESLEGSEEGRPISKVDQVQIPKWTLASLLLQHVSSTMADNIYRFASFIFMVEAYGDTLAPASIVGLSSTACGLLFAGTVGGIVDRTPRLRFVRCTVGLQKVLIAGNFAIFLVLLGPLNGAAHDTMHGLAPLFVQLKVYSIMLCTLICSSGTYLANIGINVAVERDWVTAISQGDERCLTKLNSYMTSVDVLSRIGAPLFVSAFTMRLGYIGAAKALIVMILMASAAEYHWLQIVFRRFPVLAHRDEQRRLDSKADRGQVPAPRVDRGIRAEWKVWCEFAAMPVFYTAVAKSLTFLTTLHFDATGVAYFKMAAGYSDGFLAVLRCLSMILVLVGASLMPRIDKAVGTKLTALAGLSTGVACFVPVTVAFFLQPYLSSQSLCSVVIFTGIIIARAGHMTFDLAQRKQIQIALEPHPQRNRLMALQSALEAFFTLCKYASTAVFSTSESFKWTVLISLLSNLVAVSCYIVFLRRTRLEVK